MFEISRSATRVEVEEIRPLDSKEQGLLLPGARLICESILDNDMERWMLTEGGQFIRQTGSGIYVTDSAYAMEFLAGFCDDEVMEKLVAVNAFSGSVELPKP